MKREAKELFIEVSLSLPLTKHLHYRIPEQLISSVEVGKRVLVPLGKRRVTGYVVDIVPKSDIPEIRDIIDVLDEQPLFTPHHLTFYRWISDYYFFPLGEVIKTALPSSINIESKQVIAQTISTLPEKERLVISLYYLDELTMKETGKVLNITESRVSQIHSQAVRRLRAKLRKEKLIDGGHH